MSASEEFSRTGSSRRPHGLMVKFLSSVRLELCGESLTKSSHGNVYREIDVVLIILITQAAICEPICLIHSYVI